MKQFIVSFILMFLIVVYLIYRYYQYKKIKEHMIGSLVYPNYVPNTDMTFNNKIKKSIPPFDIDYMCKNHYKYLGFPCWWRKYQGNHQNYLNNQLLDNNSFIPKNMYPKNKPLKYDGIWNKEHSMKCNDYIWKL